MMLGRSRRAPLARAQDFDEALEAHAAALLEQQRGRKPIQPAPKAARHAASVLAPLLEKASVGILELKRRWPEIVGERLANSTAPEKLSAGVLTICAPGPVAPFVQHQTALILERCRLAGAKVKSLSIRQGQPAKAAPNIRPLARPLAADEEAALEASLAGIEAGPLRAALARLGRAVRRV